MGAAGAEAAAERLVAALAASPLLVEGDQVTLSVSVGIALFDEDGCPPAKELLAANQAMYVAKAAGGGGAVTAGSHA